MPVAPAHSGSAPPPAYPTPAAGAAPAAPAPPFFPAPAAPAAPAVAAPAVPPAASAAPGNWGAGVDLGVSGVLPDFGLLATWRPYPWVHAQAGVGWNAISLGLRGGATVINPWFVPLSLTGEVGHYFEGDANDRIESLTGRDSDLAVLRKVSYSYANALVGLTTSGQHFVFYFRAGVTRLWATVKGFQETVSELAGTPMETSDAELSYYGPTVKLGMIVLY